MLRLSNELVASLREALSGIDGLEFAALFGSIVSRGESPHDIDIAVKASHSKKYEVLCKVVEVVSRVAGISEERVDVVDLDRADLEIKKEVARGIVLVDKGGYGSRLVEEVNALYPEYWELRRIGISEWLYSDDPTQINLELVKRRLDFIKTEVEFMKEHVLSRSLEEVVESPIYRRLLERSYQLVVEAMLNICRHIASAMGWGPALSYSDYVRLCTEHGVLSQELGEKLVSATRLRNLIVHRYLEVDYEKLY
ncbi:MAG: type VII toxin-antitoxin system HepT family RNase toxin, partial [Desulfurococcaceae archaeon]